MINKKRGDRLEGRLLEVLEKSPLEKREPVCSIFPACGGCIDVYKRQDSLLILGDEEQGLAMVKTEIFMELAKEILEKGGRVDEGNRDEQSDKEI